jgi:uncharacterized repeat protein (TIGR03803 family)
MKNAFLCAAVVVLGCGFTLGQATEQVLWTFTGYSDGWGPKSKLLFDNQGNLYGTTEYGGSSSNSNQSCGEGSGCGMVYELSPQPGGTWTENILYSFCAPQNSLCPDGLHPDAGLVFDESGNLYGTTELGGSEGGGTVFELSPPSVPGGAWTETVLYNFCTNKVGSQCLDGQYPASDLVFDKQGNLYGTTAYGGSGHLDYDGYSGGGTVFELSPGVNGWTEAVLYNFCSLGQGKHCPDGADPSQGVTLRDNNFYGATSSGGTSNDGTVYELSPGPNGWTQTVIFSVNSKSGGNGPDGRVSFDPAGNLYGTLGYGGANEFIGAIFRLGGKHTYLAIPPPGGGENPQSGVLVDAKRGMLYGTTWGGGNNFYYGTVFEVAGPEQATTIYNFCSQPNCADGREAGSSLIEDPSGNLYGTTELGGSAACVDGGCGVVYEITP